MRLCIRPLGPPKIYKGLANPPTELVGDLPTNFSGMHKAVLRPD